MNLLKHKNLFDSKIQLYLQRVILTGFLVLGILFFCFAQDASQDFNSEMDSYGTTNSEKRQEIYLTKIKDLHRRYQSHLDSNCLDRSKLYRNYSRHFYGVKNYDLARRYIQDSALQVALRCQEQDDNLIAQIYQNSFLTFRKLGDTVQYTSDMKSLIHYLENGNVDDYANRANLEYNVGYYFGGVLNELEKGRIWLRKSIADYGKLKITSEKSLRPINLLASLENNAGNYEFAIQQYEEILSVAKQLDLLSSAKYSTTTYYNKARAQQELGQYELAMTSVVEGLGIAAKNEDLSAKAILIGRKAFLLFELGQYDEALENIDYTINYLLANPTSEFSYYLSDYQSSKIRILLKLGRENEAQKIALQIMYEHSLGLQMSNDLIDVDNLIIRDIGEFINGISLYLKSISDTADNTTYFTISDFVDSLYFDYHNEETDLDFQSDISDSYHAFCDDVLRYIFDNELQDHHPNTTAYYISSSKSLKLFKSIDRNKKTPIELRKQQKILETKQADIQSRLEEAIEIENQDSIDSISEEYFNFSKQRNILDEKLANLNLDTDYRKHKRNFVSFAKNNLKVNEAIVALFYGDKFIIGYSLSPSTITFQSKETIPVLQSDRFLDFYSKSNLKSPQRSLDSIVNFFSSYFPIDFKACTELTIIPDGLLLYFPFEALILDSEYLIEKTAVNYGYSVNIRNFEREKSRASQDYVGFGMSYSNSLLKEIENSEELNRIFDKSFTLAPLPNAVKEIRESQAIYDGKSYLEQDCSQSNFKKYSTNSKIVHIANHSLLNSKNSKLSSIVFASDEGIELFNVIDVKTLNLQAELAILSSCNSGRGKLFDGEGIRSLGQSFSEAGCHSIVANLWEANDKSSRFIISRFHQFLKEGLSKSQALRQAKLAYIDQAAPRLSHPKYWANVVLIGDPSPINFSNGIPSLYAYLFGGLLLMLLVWLFFNRKRKLSSK